ncbi:hypothetical protein A2U01_0010083, partial [Trifolium medium]|nr:hypothetical protein [Trifolium medium]
AESHEVGVAVKRWPLLLKKEAYLLLLELGLKKAIAGPSQNPSIPYVKGVEWGFLTPVWANPTLSPKHPLLIGKSNIPIVVTDYEYCWRNFSTLYNLLNFVYDIGKMRGRQTDVGYKLDTITGPSQVSKPWLFSELMIQVQAYQKNYNWQMGDGVGSLSVWVQLLSIFNSLSRMVYISNKLMFLQLTTTSIKTTLDLEDNVVYKRVAVP